MMQRAKQLAVCLLVLALLPALRAADEPQTTVKLLLSHESARPGETITAAIEVTSNPNWHTYWRNPGDAGLATTIEWELPAAVSAGAIQWPVPHKMELMKLAAYVYEGTEYLLVPITIASETKAGSYDLKGDLTWLECEKICVRQTGSVSQKLMIGSESKASAAATIIEKARERLPRKLPPFDVNASWLAGSELNKRILVLEWASTDATKADFYPYESDVYTVDAATKLETAAGKVRLQKQVTLSDESGKWPPSIPGLVLNDSAAKEPIGFEVNLTVPEKVTAAATATPVAGSVQNRAAAGPTAPAQSLLLVLGLAFLGGLILNIMPCVLPVIALKILSFVNQSGSDPRRTRRLGLIYALGVIVSFAILAGVVLAVERATGLASWGMQYQNPVFLVVMITLVTLIALNLFGVFEITLGGKTMGSASELASREGPSGAFFNGMLATVLGTSCTAPFLTFAIGYAIGQSAFITILIFLMMGVGLAFPYVLLTWNPALLRLLPKPGAWMERFKVAMGFPMLATAVWLYGVAVNAHFGTKGAFWLAMFLLIIGLAAWIYGAFLQRGVAHRGLASMAMIGALVFAITFVLEKQLSWRKPNYAKSASTIENTSGIAWQKWSPEAVAKARAEGKPILVDFTADWCLNCQANKISSIEIEPVIKKLKEIGAVAMLGDFTRSDPVIAQELRKFKRSAVPLVLIYSSDPNEEPRVLPEILTPGIVLEALDWAGKDKLRSNRSLPETAAR